MKLKPELFTDAKFEATVPAGTPTIFFGSNGAVLKTRNFQLEKTVGVLGKSGNFYKVIRSNGLITYVPQASITPVARARKSKEK